MLDPVIALIISVGFTLLLIGAGGHKLTNRLRFRGILEGYQVLPGAMVRVAAFVIGPVELLLGFSWVTGWQRDFVALATALLLTLYAIAIAINLVRGRTYIDCGCGFSVLAVKQSEQQGIQQLSAGLLLRNGVLVLGALLAILPSTGRLLGFIDYLSTFSAILVLVFIYAAFNQLLLNNNAIKSWRHTHA
ncbi:MAG: methylamine utilization protein MauE [Proteobacteria bacterium]|nr:methylamine utilization protein MauE [Pseudomonadota bacterium]